MPVYIPNENGELTTLEQTILESTPQISANMPNGDLGAAFSKMFLSLFFLVLLLYVSYWFLKRMIQNRQQKSSGNASIQIIEKRMISAKTMLYLIEVENKRILIAESQLEIKRLEGLEATPPE